MPLQRFIYDLNLCPYAKGGAPPQAASAAARGSNPAYGALLQQQGGFDTDTADEDDGGAGESLADKLGSYEVSEAFYHTYEDTGKAGGV
jgi:hypothetical protein